MTRKSNYTLLNKETGNLAFKVYTFSDNGSFDHIQRLNYYMLIWIIKGTGIATADFSAYDFSEHTLLAFSPYQPFMISTENELEGIAISFHPDFFCIHKHHQEVACNGVLFNNIYDPPMVHVNKEARDKLKVLTEQMKSEIQNAAVAQYELLISYLKIFLITASRLKVDQYPESKTVKEVEDTPFAVQNLKSCIEKHYKSKHAPSDYADLLAISPKALARITKKHFNKTLTTLISERIIIEAKRELYLTNKTVKEIAYELGYNDEYYFSRFFKKNTDVSPTLYRETVGFDRAFEIKE
ncbi:MAG: helix-turn-helix domain-containing protein [Balneolaceae bacterium]|nr:helix-turn-helix domain-containing protein [Balneolaceae bacterium]